MSDEKKSQLKKSASGVQTFQDNDLRNFLMTTTAESLVAKRKVITVGIRTSVTHAIDVLSRNKILSCPVLDDGDGKHPVGFLTLDHIMQYVLVSVPNDPKESDFNNLLDDVSVKDVLDKVETDTFVVTYDTNSVSLFVEMFAQGLHRTALFQADPEKDDEDTSKQSVLSFILSQSDIVRFLAGSSKVDKISHLFRAQISRLGLVPKKVISVSANTSVLECLLKSFETKASHLAVNDDDGNTVATFSSSSLRGITHEDFARLLEPVHTFLKSKHSAALAVPKLDVNATFGQLLEKFSTDHHHHTYLVDANKKTVGIVTLTDTMRALLNYKRDSTAEKQELATALQTTLPVPGTLTIKVLRCSGLDAQNTYLKLKFPHGRVEKSRVIRDTDSPQWLKKKDKSTVYEVDNVTRGKKIVIEVWELNRWFPDKLLGHYIIRVPWVLDGFGTGTSTQTSFTDTTSLAGPSDAQGEIEVLMAYEAKKK